MTMTTGRLNATRVTVSTFGALAAIMGIEHGIGAMLQGGVAPGAVAFESWPDAPAFGVLSGEPAMTVVPNLLVTGLLAVGVSSLFLIWATVLVRRRNAGRVLILLAVLMLLVGAGFGPPLLGLIVGATATRIDAPPARARSRIARAAGRTTARLWPWFYGLDVLAWLLLFPGTVLVESLAGLPHPDLVVLALTFSAFGLLLLTIASGFAHDAARRAGAHLPAGR